MKKIKKPLIFTLAIFPLAVVGTYFAVLMSFSQATSSIIDEAVKEVGSMKLLVILSMLQPMGLTLLCAFFGYILSEKVGLMKPFKFKAAEFFKVLFISVICGGIFSLDAWTFSKLIPQVAEIYKEAGSFDAVTWIASVLYGGVIEEVMMRLFFMTLLAFLINKLFYKNKNEMPSKALVISNIISALAFAALHLPSTSILFGEITVLIVLRCFLLNGAFGLIFGRIYRKFGIYYAMMAHMLCHIIARTIWIIAF